MNREFKPTSTLLRTMFATASLLVSVMVVGSMTSLADTTTPSRARERAAQRRAA
jgi:hypothetical protein